MFSRFFTALALCVTTQATAQTLTVAIDTVASTDESKFIKTCKFSGSVTNSGPDDSQDTVTLEYRLREGTFSAMSVPNDGSHGRQHLSGTFGLAAGETTRFDASFLGVDCEHLDAVNFGLTCEESSSDACAATLVGAGNNVLPIQIGDAAVIGDDLIEKGPLHGVWQVRTSDGLDLMTLDVQNVIGVYIEMTFIKGPDYCTVAAAYCDATAATMVSDRIYLQDDGEVRATLFVDRNSHRIHWDITTGIGTFRDSQFGWANANIIVRRAE